MTDVVSLRRVEADNEVRDDQPICDAPCRHGGLSAARKYSRAELGHMWHCNRRVKVPGDRCWQHKEPKTEPRRRT